MSEPTIQELIEELIEKTRMFHGNSFYESKSPGMCGRYRAEMDYARAVLISRIAALQQEAFEWHKMADELAGELNEANSKIYSVSWEDASESSPAWIAYCNLRDRKGIKTSSDNNKKRYNHAYQSDKISTEGTEVK